MVPPDNHQVRGGGYYLQFLRSKQFSNRVTGSDQLSITPLPHQGQLHVDSVSVRKVSKKDAHCAKFFRSSYDNAQFQETLFIGWFRNTVVQDIVVREG